MSLFKKCYDYRDPEEARAAGIYPYFRPIAGCAGPHVIVDGKEKIMIGSNNYLGLANHPEVLAAAKEAVDRYGAGCTGSRFLNGNMDIHDELEERLARFVQKEAAIVFSTGFFVNAGTIPTITSRHSVILSDRENHASIAEGCQLSLGKVIRYQSSDMDALEAHLKRQQEVKEKLIVSDGVFSMSGEVCRLADMVRLAKQYGAKLLIDEAHALGVLGDHGRGTGEHFKLQQEVDLVMGTFSKSLASIGGFLAGPYEVISYVKHHARPLIFSASPPPASIAVALKSLEIMEREPELREKLHRNTDMAKEGLKELGYNVGSGEAAIVPVNLDCERDFTFTVAQALFDRGLFSTPVIPPATPPGKSAIRTSYMASHSEEDIKKVLQVFAEVGEEFGLIGRSNSVAAAAQTGQ